MTIGVNNITATNPEIVVTEKKDDEIKIFTNQPAGDVQPGETVNTLNLDSKTALINKFAPIFANYQCKFDIKFVCYIACCSENELLTADENTIKNIQEALKAAFAKIKYDPVEDNINDIINLAKNYNLALMTGWSIKNFDEKFLNGESLSKKMIRFFDLPKDFDFKTASPEKIKDYLSRYFISYFKTKEKEGYDRKTIVKLQLQDFGKMLINTPPEEKKLFKEAIKLLLAENKHQGLQAVLASFANEDEATNFADSWNSDDLESFHNKDISGADAQKSMNSTTLLISQKSETGTKNFHAEMLQKEAKYQEIKKKYENGEELTDLEQYILDNHEVNTSMKSAVMIALHMNENLTEDFKKTFAELVNKDYSRFDDYRNVLEGIREYIQSNPNDAILNSQEMLAFLDEITNGNYSIVADDLKNGTVSSLNISDNELPANNTDENNTRPSLGLTSPDSNYNQPPSYTNPKNYILENVEEIETLPTYMGHSAENNEYGLSVPQMLSASTTTLRGAKAKFNSEMSFIKNVLSNKYQVAINIIDYAYERLKNLSKNGQELVINSGIDSTYIQALATDGELKVNAQDLDTYGYNVKKTVEEIQNDNQ